ncbi:hypothetical protein [uncultured Thiocystis sp.]|jgi:hypothetical protein|uniref:hypothetical protein n=1 Tax=uncultured Thiocystis sp. TaxID=1202134 RepID=UPI0025EDCE71|nr:hypothetical protein [uncultured Thiocystis sp.]
MADVQFDLSFDGTLVPDADPSAVRRQLGALFKLDDAGVARLFTGKPVFVRHAVDVATAAKFERVFAQAGAVLTIAPCEEARVQSEVAEHGDADPNEASPVRAEASPAPSAPSGLALAPQDGFLEPTGPVKIPDLDTSYLSLVSSPDWSLEDCEPTVAPAPAADLSHLSLAAIDTPDPRDNTD